MKHPDYPSVSRMIDRHGKIRWRFRRSGKKDVMLPGEPHSDEFNHAYQMAVVGQSNNVIAHQNFTSPRSMKAAYHRLKETRDWYDLDDKSKRRYQQTIERILSIPVGRSTIGDGAIDELKRNHVKYILDQFRDTPYMERIVLICIRKLIYVAIDEEWIEVDPTFNIKRNPKTDGHKAWPADIMARYEHYWDIGTRQRTAYALALWLGNRASDICRLKWSDLTTKSIMENGELREIEGFEFVQFKGRKYGRTIFLPITPMLAEALAPLDRSSEAVLLSSHNRPYKDATITVRMAEWCSKAGIPPGYTLHGLRKALGVKLAEADASTRQLMETLGHNNIAFAELYSREASQIRLAVQGMDKVANIEKARKNLKLVTNN